MHNEARQSLGSIGRAEALGEFWV